MTALEKTFQDAAKQAIGGDRQHGWGIKDSMEVIETVIVADAEAQHLARKPEDPVNGYMPSDECLKLIELVVNPSQARQAFEKAGLLAESTTKRHSKGLAALMTAVDKA
jgi:hypothetical protein